jgi:hypothetical protein
MTNTNARAIKSCSPILGLVSVCLVGAFLMSVARGQVAAPLELPAALTTLGQTVMVDWSRGVIVATGKSRVRAQLSDAEAEVRGVQGARADAVRLLTAAVDALPVSSGMTVAQCKANSPTATLRLEAIVRGALPVAGSEKVEKQPDGSRVVSAALTAPLAGKEGVSSAVLSEMDACLKKPSSTDSKSVSSQALSASPSAGSGVTGLIVDARGLGLKPCLGPRFLMPDGTALSAGVPAWARSLEEAAKLKDRVGANPLTLKATSVSGTGRCDLVFDAANLERLRRSISEARVVIVP